MGTPAIRADGAPSKFFILEEFGCRCGGRHGIPCHGYPEENATNQGINVDLVTFLDRLRSALGAPIHLNCGYRCPAHNAFVGGVKNSWHVQGRAADITTKVRSPRDLFLFIEKTMRMPGMGLYDGFVHIDVRPNPDGHLARWDNRKFKEA